MVTAYVPSSSGTSGKTNETLRRPETVPRSTPWRSVLVPKTSQPIEL